METLSLYFQVVFAGTALGESLYICGDIEQLGCWETGVKLETSKDIFPYWKSSRIGLPKNTKFQFKLCIKDGNGNLLKWEKLVKNREFAIISSMQITVRWQNFHLETKVLERRASLNYRKINSKNVNQIGDVSSQSSGGWESLIKQQQFIEEAGEEVYFLKEALDIYHNWDREKKSVHIFGHQQISQKMQTRHILMEGGNKNLQQSKQSSETLCSLRDYPSSQKILKLQDLNQLHKISNKYIHFLHFNINNISQEQIHLLEANFSKLIIICHIQSFINQQNDHKNFQLFKKLSQFTKIFIIQQYEYFENLITELHENLSTDEYKIKMQKQDLLKIKWQSKNECNLIMLGYYKQIVKMEQIEDLIQSKKYFQLPKSVRIHKLLHATPNTAYKIVINCDKLSQIPHKILTNICNLGYRKNIEMFIVSKQIDHKIQNSFISMINDRIVMAFLTGSVYIYSNKYDILEQLGEQNDFQTFFQFIIRKAHKIIPNIIIQQKGQQLCLSIKDSAFGDIFIKWLQVEIKKTSERLHKFLYIEKEIIEGRLNIKIQPLFSDPKFYCKVICETVGKNSESDVLCFNFTKKRIFLECLEQICGEKGLKYEGFCIGEENENSQNISLEQASEILLEIYQKI